MRIFILPQLLFWISFGCASAQDYFQQKVDYLINAELDAENHLLRVEGEMRYFNNSNDTLDHLIIHLWMNAFSDKQSHWAIQQIQMGSRDFHFSKEEDRGSYTEIEFKLNGHELGLEQYLEDGKACSDIAILRLNQDLLPSSLIHINFSYSLDIPTAFDRPGYKQGLFRMTQWYPKPAVYDRNGWHPLPYLSMGEFYSEYGDYEVELTLPLSFSLASTGVEDDLKSELILQERKRKIYITAENVHDFAWFASEEYIPYQETLELESKSVFVHLFVKQDFTDIDRIFDNAASALKFLSKELLEYPYPQISLVQESDEATSGMEYPMITILDLESGGRRVDHLIAHELAHQWFYSLLGSNERDQPWIDEGFSNYYDRIYDQEHYGPSSYDAVMGLDSPILASSGRDIVDQAIMHLYMCNFIMPIAQSNISADPFNYVSSNYARMARAYEYLCDYMGDERFKTAIKRLFNLWSNKHPAWKDIQAVFESATGENLDWFFVDYIQHDEAVDFSIQSFARLNGENRLILKRESLLNFPVKLAVYDQSGYEAMNSWIASNGNDIQSIALPEGSYDHLELNKGLEIYDSKLLNNSSEKNKKLPLVRFNNIIQNPLRPSVGLVPHLFFNSYDGLMLGPSLYTSLFPQQDIRYVFSPSFAIGSSEPVGFAAIEKDILLNTENNSRKLSVSLTAKRFNYGQGDELLDEPAYWKISPKIAWHGKSGLTKYWSLDYRWLLASQQERIVDLTQLEYRTFNAHQINMHLYKANALTVTRMHAQLQFEDYSNIFDQDHSYLRLKYTADLQFYYNKLSRFFLRAYGAYFPHNTRSESSSYSSALTRGSTGISSQGFMDQFYEQLYFERSSLDARQIYIEDGGFKTAFGPSRSIGMTNHAMAALNVKVDMPMVLPLNLRIRPYMDMALASTKQLSGDPRETEFYYSGGLSIEMGEVFGVYIPLFNSDNIVSGYDSSKILDRLSFTFNLQALNPWENADHPGKFLLF